MCWDRNCFCTFFLFDWTYFNKPIINKRLNLKEVLYSSSTKVEDAAVPSPMSISFLLVRLSQLEPDDKFSFLLIIFQSQGLYFLIYVKQKIYVELFR